MAENREEGSPWGQGVHTKLHAGGGLAAAGTGQFLVSRRPSEEKWGVSAVPTPLRSQSHPCFLAAPT